MWTILFAMIWMLSGDDYFVRNQTPVGILDRESNRRIVSVAATGMGMDCLAISVQEGKLDRKKTIEWVNDCIDKTMEINKTNKGWLYHFIDVDGNPAYNKEVSSIDSTLFYLGARQAAVRLNDEGLITKIDNLIGGVDVSWMMSGGYFRHGFHWKDGSTVFIDHLWKDYSEGVLIYRLFNVPYAPPRTSLDLPLFVYYYPLCFYREKPMIDLLGLAIDRQIEKHGTFGVTACDGPKGYSIYNPNLISPLAISSCESFFPDKAKRALGELKISPTTPSIEIKTGWTSNDRIGIDEAAYIILNKKR